MAVAAVVFLVLLSLAVTGGGASLDRRFGIPQLDLGLANHILGGALALVGLFFGFWSIGDQLIHGRGTPLPVMPTQELLTQGPFRYCRNPMTQGTVLAYSGLGLAARTVSGIGLVLCFGALLLLYIKNIEEKELAERFGDAYLAYERDVPFLLPRPPRRR
jgi:protein-S-isoprenylcysteine O-methyltransferase Ste14